MLKQGPTTLLPDRMGNSFALLIQNIRDRHYRAFAGKQFADRTPNTQRASGNNRDFILHAPHQRHLLLIRSNINTPIRGYSLQTPPDTATAHPRDHKHDLPWAERRYRSDWRESYYRAPAP